MNIRIRWLPAIALALTTLLSPSLQAEEGNLRLNLICRGSGVATRTESKNVSHYDPKSKQYAHTNAQYSSKENFEGIVVVEIADGIGRIKLPDQMVPSLNTKDEGWFKIHDLVVSPETITGRIKVNFMNNKQLRIDRRSGLLTIDGGGTGFSGECEAVDKNMPRKF